MYIKEIKNKMCFINSLPFRCVGTFFFLINNITGFMKTEIDVTFCISQLSRP